MRITLLEVVAVLAIGVTTVNIEPLDVAGQATFASRKPVDGIAANIAPATDRVSVNGRAAEKSR
jgi:hypothetical protein